jgi:hypothetical protein
MPKEDFPSLNNAYNQSPQQCRIHFSVSNEAEDLVNIAWSKDMPKDGQTAFKYIMQDLTGTVNGDLAIELHAGTAAAMPGSMYGDLPKNKNIAAQFLSELQPKDATEAMLCSQLIALHAQAMEYLRRAEKAELLHFQDSCMNNASKLLRLHHATLEALMRYRRKGEQKVVVQHQYVQVNDGGQAIVGSHLMPGSK